MKGLPENVKMKYFYFLNYILKENILIVQVGIRKDMTSAIFLSYDCRKVHLWTRIFDSSFNQSQHISAISTVKLSCDWLKNEHKVATLVRQCY